MTFTPLQKLRQKYLPKLPKILHDISSICWEENDPNTFFEDNSSISKLFPETFGFPYLTGKYSHKKGGQLIKVGVVFSGGQAPGGHNVITGLFDSLNQLHSESQLFGFLDGPSGIINGNYKELTEDFIFAYRNQGGFDLIGSGRVKIEKEEDLKASLEVVRNLELDGLVIIGGDDSNTNAAVLAEYFKANHCKTNVIGVPKTIDADLRNACVSISFGFDTACKIYSEIIGNIARDAASAKKYTHFIKLMGRSASHIALECALSTQPNMTLISEEVQAEKMTLDQVTCKIANMICRRAELGKNFSVILIPEGLIEFIPEIALLIQELNLLLPECPSATPIEITPKLSDLSKVCFTKLPEPIQKQLLLHRDPHGNVQVSLIETEHLLIQTVSVELERRKASGKFLGSFSPMHHFLGYEGRAGFPSNFDCHYCYALGFVASLLIHEERTGYMACIKGLTKDVSEWTIGAIPLTQLMHLEVRKGKEKAVIQKVLVDLQGKAFSRLKHHRKSWELEDEYLYPGPIQFTGDLSLTDSVPISLLLEQ